jgi:hypothetical protein
MHIPSTANNVAELYPIKASQDEIGAGPVASAMRHLSTARDALDVLRAGLPGGPDRWQADSLFVAQEGLRRAWLALANPNRSLKDQQSR